MPNNLKKDGHAQKFVISSPTIVFDLIRHYLSLQTLVGQITPSVIDATVPFLDSQPFLSCLPDAVPLSLWGVHAFVDLYHFLPQLFIFFQTEESETITNKVFVS